MSYNVRFTDTDKADLVVYDNTSNNDTSLVLPGRNVTGYGQIIAENFLHLLENFASTVPPVSPIEGQLWYDSDEGSLKISDGLNWKASSGIYKGAVEPSLQSSKVGELWVDTINQQLRIFNGSRWILVGPNQTSIGGLKYGPTIETIADTDGNNRSLLIFYLADVPVIIVSKDSFIPRLSISGYASIKSGININLPVSSVEKSQFDGGELPKLIGTATIAESLINAATGEVVLTSKFLRSDAINTTETAFNIRNNTGLTIGIDQNFSLSTGTSGTARIYNSTQGSSIDFQINRNGLADTIIKISDNKVGINNSNPQQELDVSGNVIIRPLTTNSGILTILNNSESTNLNTGSFKTSGGVSITKNLRVGTDVILNEAVGTITQTREIRPESTDVHNLGSSLYRWNTVHAKRVVADTVEGVIVGNINGNANTATSLRTPTTFKVSGDVESPAITFDGQVGDYNKVFQTVLTSNVISSKSEPPGNTSRKTDYVLAFRPSEPGGAFSGLFKQTRDSFVADLGLPIGAILPYAGPFPTTGIPGFLLCDGSEVSRSQYPDLFSVIGNFYNGTTPLLGLNTFRLPDLRGRFPLGCDVMNNNLTVSLPDGSSTTAGGGQANRVDGAGSISQVGGASTTVLNLGNIPDHSHTMTASNGSQFYAVRNDPATVPGSVSGPAPTVSGQSRYLPDSGTVKKTNGTTSFSTPFNTMNPFLTINYIIRSGPPAFTVA